MKQQIFQFSKDIHQYNTEDFIVSLCNLEAYKYVTEDISWPLGRLIILGEKGSGKTHLAKIWQSISGAQFICSFSDLLNQQETNDKFIIDTFNISDNELFDIINHCQNNSFELLITLNSVDNFKLNDLKSRINASKKILIKQPDLETLKILIFKHFSQRQLNISQDVVEYIASRFERSYCFIQELINEIDRLSLEEKRNITIPLIKKVIEDNFLKNASEENTTT